jgi:hypothetical protein
MTDEEINIAIAQACGWVRIYKSSPLGCAGQLVGLPPNAMPTFENECLIPDYINDHSAIYAAEKYIGLHDRNNLELRVKWVGILRDLVAPFCPLNKVGTSVVSDIDILTADSRIKAMALVKLTHKKKKAYTVAMTCSGGTAIAGDYLAESEDAALKAAKVEHGDEWTYYIWPKHK